MLIRLANIKNLLILLLFFLTSNIGYTNFYVVHDSPILSTNDTCEISINFSNSIKSIDRIKFKSIDEKNQVLVDESTKPKRKKVTYYIPRKTLLNRQHQYLFKVYYEDSTVEERKIVINNKLNRDGLVPFLVNRKKKDATKASTFKLIIALDYKNTPDSVNYCVKKIIDSLFETHNLLSRYSHKFDFYFTEECAEIRRGKGLYHHIKDDVLKSMNITSYTGIGILHNDKKFRDYHYSNGNQTKLFSANVMRPHVFTHELFHMIFSLSDEYEESDQHRRGHEIHKMNPVYPNMFTDRLLALEYCKQNNISVKSIKSVRTNAPDGHDWHKICNHSCIMNGPRPNERPTIGKACAINIENHLKNKR